MSPQQRSDAACAAIWQGLVTVRHGDTREARAWMETLARDTSSPWTVVKAWYERTQGAV